MARKKKTENETTSEINPKESSLSEIADTQESVVAENISEAETVSLSADDIPPTVLVKEDEVKTAVLEANETVKVEAAKPLVIASAATASNGGMSTLSKALTVGLVILLGGIGLLVWKSKVSGHDEGLTKLSKKDMETIFKDAPPMALKRLAEDPELKKEQIKDIKQFLAVAQEARSTGFANQEDIKKDLEEIRMTITAVSYDKEKNKEKENLPPFASYTKESVDAFFQKDGNAEKFDKLVKEQIEKAKKAGKLPENFEPPAEQLDQAKEQYAKVRIAAEEAKTNWSSLGEEFKSTTELQIKLQQAQYLEQKYDSAIIAKKIIATDAEINNYLAQHPEEAKIIEAKKAQANEILQRAKAGEDFAKLAQEFSEDPGSKKDGGLYKNVTKGGMVSEFEKAALALEVGQVTENLVETKFGYHIIKLERKGITKDKDGKETETYDARHILISTVSGEADPTNPMAQPMPLKDKIKASIEKEKKDKLLDEILARHPIEIEDFEIKVPPMPPGQEGMQPGMPNGNGQPQMDPKQMEELQKQLKQLQEKQKNAPKPAGQEAPKKADKAGK